MSAHVGPLLSADLGCAGEAERAGEGQHAAAGRETRARGGAQTGSGSKSSPLQFGFTDLRSHSGVTVEILRDSTAQHLFVTFVFPTGAAARAEAAGVHRETDSGRNWNLTAGLSKENY